MPVLDPSGLLYQWGYRPTAPSARVQLKRWRSWATGRLQPPRARVLRAPVPAERWNVLFLFAPSATLNADQQRILTRMRALAGRLLVVCALPDLNASVPPLVGCADAIIAKELRGFDFSAYRLALEAIAHHAPGATAYLQNDSVLGPFGDINRLIEEARWDLTGFMGARSVENHLCSFALVLRDVTPVRVAALRPVLSPAWCCDAFDDVVLLQETRLARVAAHTMSVGAWWYTPTQPSPEPLVRRLRAQVPGAAQRPPNLAGDATLACPVALLDAGFPFLKRSLFGKFAGLHDPRELLIALRTRGW